MAPPTSRLPAPGRPALERDRPTSMFEVSTENMRRLQQIGAGRQSPAEGAPSQGEDTTQPAPSSKQSKRRSLLPQSFTRKFSSDGREAAATTAPIKEDASGSDEGRRSEDRAAMPPPPKPRPTSMMRPPNSIPRKDVPSHTRLPSKDKDALNAPARNSSIAKPASSSASTAVQSGLRRGNSTKLPQSPVSRTSNQHAATNGRSGSADLGVVQKRSSPPATASKRASVSLSKPPSLNTALAPSTQTQPSPTSPTRSSAKSRTPATSKPAFNTYQQHYSPAKSTLPKPGIPGVRATHKATNSTEDVESLPFDVALEQIELLQLSLMHQTSFTTLRAYEASAKQKLGKMHAKLQKEYQSIQKQEQQNRRATNLDALETWCPDPALLAEHLQTVSRAVSDLRAHTESGSRYSELVRIFEEWVIQAETVLMGTTNLAAFIEALPESWRSQHTSLALNLRSIQRDLSTLPPLPPPASPPADATSLHVLIDNCASLADSMVRELEMMAKLQKELLQQGKSRIDSHIGTLVSGTNSGSGKENWKPVWQSVGS
ncbi:hypothetical protein CB0940_01448 [Cercospora beticola]|uniref:Uncharacterized protein n=1 Tax=Cercospora beticola TaxID=122368 RepID=A0A2G5ICL0_CERBT|nr:hypothetical protein CB0940_01448 [Cercospora beticola]PIB02515.1 hypothetical protein CB0940_01448 [Cercospora beticola]WPA96886.1 hypothetical protein RHO25_001494 [Cercospora beticola]